MSPAIRTAREEPIKTDLIRCLVTEHQGSYGAWEVDAAMARYKAALLVAPDSPEG